MFKIVLVFLALIKTVQADKPAWLNNVSAACKKSELCAVGMGESRVLAEANAKSNIAKMFQVKVTSTFSSQEIYDGGESLLSAFEDVKEETQMELEGVTHPEAYSDDKYYYSLAKIKKFPLSNSIRKEMKDIAQEVRGLKDSKKSGAVFEIEHLMLKWRLLNARQRFLTGMDSSEPISVSDIMQMKKRTIGGIIVHLFIDGKGKEVKVLNSYVGDLLTGMGFDITKGKMWKKESTHLLAGSLKEEEEFFKVEGFKKFRYTLTLDAENRRRVKSGSLHLDTVQTGRNDQQAREKALVYFKKQIKDEIHKISFKR